MSIVLSSHLISNIEILHNAVHTTTVSFPHTSKTRLPTNVPNLKINVCHHTVYFSLGHSIKHPYLSHRGNWSWPPYPIWMSYSNLHSSTNRKHFRAFVYVWNGAFTVGNGNVSLLMWRVTVQSIIQLFFMFWCAFVYVSVFPSSRYCKSGQTCLYSYFLWLERIIMGLEILKRAQRHIKTWQLRQK
jgi:hypothetical protein